MPRYVPGIDSFTHSLQRRQCALRDVTEGQA